MFCHGLPQYKFISPKPKDMDTPFMPMGVFGILREALKIPSKNGKLFLSITLLFLIPSSLLYLANNFAIKPLVTDISAKSVMLQDNDPQRPGYTKLMGAINKDAGILVSGEMIFLLISSMVSLFAITATISASAMAYYRKDLTHNELFIRIGRTWKRPLITRLYIILFNSGCLFLILILIGMLKMFAMGLPIALACLLLVLALLFLCFYGYISVICNLGIVISVIEESNYGIGALAKAAELIKGRKRQGYIIYVLFKLVGLAIYWVLGSAMQVMHLTHASSLVLVNIGSLETILLFMVFTMFYIECKKSHGEKVEIEGESGYSLVPTIPLVDASLSLNLQLI
ncbi:uncharacterized protein LOC131256842 [Magnolia sinica]|uniref:uncharacterized protein LOC131256842 n=1 Tax=Magnolia sinica TaxID=86752 RepID=UPI002657B0FA|nr:uncharacterized protein LOC131256842 [Magnolia sinica]